MQSLQARVGCRPLLTRAPCCLGGARRALAPRGIRRLEMQAPAQAQTSATDTYSEALELARVESFAEARVTFESLLSRQPTMCKAWVSWAQMEKRCHRGSERWLRMRSILQRGLTLNPHSACLIQAFGLMELQRGNWLAAVMMLERCARLDANCVPVLRWQLVQNAKKTVGSRGPRQRGAAGASGGITSVSA
ncbi:hypothetical protein TSOC_006069 [Tetrabaena socialis]|uniref:PsbB mRNA maturation factor Mbb1, chloroplastic n=1 Tax=Tetrabaena socialis TaxID=47790 RepID=A0A2J8A4P0_9CHLO|nr:hypothetical protein TSOC_006069 [Tetrabaena socialis]|eukprot:PNH07477.1 hypothetical protein TSOC_006069 [Tetrabaena socialis]